MTKMKAFDVMLNGKRVETVFFRADSTVQEVKQSLVEYDKYDPDIEVEELG
jgi:hypothetical protein